MKRSFSLFFCVVMTTNLYAQGVTKYGERTATSTNFVDQNGKIGSRESLVYMKLFLLMSVCVFITTNLCVQGLTKYGENTTTSTSFVDQNGEIGSVQILDKYGKILGITYGTVIDAATGSYYQFNLKQAYAKKKNTFIKRT